MRGGTGLPGGWRLAIIREWIRGMHQGRDRCREPGAGRSHWNKRRTGGQARRISGYNRQSGGPGLFSVPWYLRARPCASHAGCALAPVAAVAARPAAIRRLLMLLLLAWLPEVFAMEYTNGFALQTQDGEPVGFMLGSPSFKDEEGDCIFMPMPGLTDAGSRIGTLVARLKAAGEHRWLKREGGVRVTAGDAPVLQVDSDGLVRDGTGAVIGSALAIPEQD